MLLYVHVPFCRSKCDYCGFHSEIVSEEAREAYVSHLLREISFWGRKLKKPQISSVFFGGGTPSLLPARDLMDITRALRKHFKQDKDVEVSFECNPDSVADKEYARALKIAGVTRISLGVQSFDDKALTMLGRRHSAMQAINAFTMLRGAGFNNINMDLIWGLPGQRLKLWREQLKFACELAPDHLSCYGLTVEDGTPLEHRCLSRELELPHEEELARMFLYGADYLESQGYLQYEISNFAKMGFFCKHNLGYWEGQDYLGVGPAAVSTISGERWENPTTVRHWVQTVENVQLGKNREPLDLPTRVKELVMLRLRTARGLRLKAYREITGREFTKQHNRLVRALHQNNLLRISKGYLRLTRRGMLVSDTIVENFFRNMDLPELEEREGADSG